MVKTTVGAMETERSEAAPSREDIALENEQYILSIISFIAHDPRLVGMLRAYVESKIRLDACYEARNAMSRSISAFARAALAVTTAESVLTAFVVESVEGCQETGDKLLREAEILRRTGTACKGCLGTALSGAELSELELCNICQRRWDRTHRQANELIELNPSAEPEWSAPEAGAVPAEEDSTEGFKPGPQVDTSENVSTSTACPQNEGGNSSTQEELPHAAADEVLPPAEPTSPASTDAGPSVQPLVLNGANLPNCDVCGQPVFATGPKPRHMKCKGGASAQVAKPVTISASRALFAWELLLQQASTRQEDEEARKLMREYVRAHFIESDFSKVSEFIDSIEADGGGKILLLRLTHPQLKGDPLYLKLKQAELRRDVDYNAFISTKNKLEQGSAVTAA